MGINSEVSIMKNDDEDFIIVRVVNYAGDSVKKDIFKVFYMGDIDSDDFAVTGVSHYDDPVSILTGDGKKMKEIVEACGFMPM